ncbi:MAG: hypothetical protein RIC87_21715 [Kiloniellales bacterium]
MNAINTRSHVLVALADEALDRPEGTVAMTGGLPFCWAPAASGDLRDEALDRPEGTVAMTGGLPFCWAPSSPESLADQALDRPGTKAEFCISWVSDEVLDRPGTAAAFTRLCARAQGLGGDLADEALDRERETVSRFSSACFCAIIAEASEAASQPCKASDEDLGGVRPAIAFCHPSPPAEPGERPADAKGGKVVRLSDYRKSDDLDRLVA